MTILVNHSTRLLCQGMTGWAGTYHTNRMIQYGTKVVAGVTPGKGGRSHIDVPVFDSVAEAVRATRANASAVFVPPDRAAGAMIEAIEAEMPLVVAVTERVPVLDCNVDFHERSVRHQADALHQMSLFGVWLHAAEQP